MIVDYTLPAAVNENAQFYAANRLPLVMGTTGGDREKLMADVAASGSYAVIAPNMGKQIVAFQVGGWVGGVGGACRAWQASNQTEIVIRPLPCGLKFSFFLLSRLPCFPPCRR